ncbi:hypothetical protein DH2020_036784 [Rehmannia glutinosa]|uniref:Non-haem dioxygenase N-terminal domain-containing protein n=1 Tax=Rehmannia glutinosa TaxID=99300 RepID=A0ABR0V3F0_REHGL
MEKEKLPHKSRSIFSSSTVAPPPSPIPTAKGSRSAADPVLSEYIDASAQIPELSLPQHVHRFKPEEINYESLASRENDSVRRLLRSVREFGVLQIKNHGILTEELRFALANSERIFGLTVECCSSYGDHEKIVWRGDDGQVMEEATAAIGEQNYQIFRQKMGNVAKQLKAIAEELVQVIAPCDVKQFEEPIKLGESTLSIYRYHRANIIDRISSVIGQTRQESGPYALSLHLLLESTEFCWANLSFNTGPNTIVVTMGKELEVRLVILGLRYGQNWPIIIYFEPYWSGPTFITFLDLVHDQG